MPLLRDWRLHHPRDWQPQHMVDYIVDTRAALAQGMIPTVACAGAPASVGILMTVVVDIATAHPEARDKILEIVAGRFEQIENVETRRVQ